MDIINTAYTNKIFTPPAGWDETLGPCLDAPVCDTGTSIIFWLKPSEEDLENLNKGYPIYIELHTTQMPVVSFMVDNANFEEGNLND